MRESLSSSMYGIARVSLGLVQGLALYLVYLAYDNKVFPATDWRTFAPLLLVLIFVPLLVSQSLGNLRLKTLCIWAAIATVIVAGLTYYNIWHGWPDEHGFAVADNHNPDPLQSFHLFAALCALLFVSQSLILAADADKKLIPVYPLMFDAVTKLAVQAALAVLFTGAFWAVLGLASGLFRIIGINIGSLLFQKPWFAIPASTLAIAVAIHVSDVRADIVRGIRTLGLALVSWLLPMMTFIAVAFLVALFFTGLQPLWDTKFATVLLLLTAAGLVALINAAYQDGDPAHPVLAVLRYAGSLAALALVPLIVLAYAALALRVEQYGWTVERIYAMACVLVAGFCTAGYVVAALWLRGPWLKRIERWNIYTAFVTLAVLVALFTPIADPFRISVASQVARLESGATAPEKFDFEYLRFSGGRYGYAALETLKTTEATTRAAFVRQMAESAEKATSRNPVFADPDDVAERVLDRIDIRTPGKTLPASFLPQTLQGSFGCLSANMTARCDAFIEDIDDDGKDEVLFMEGMVLRAMRENENGKWIQLGHWTLPFGCDKLREAMQMGGMHLVPPTSPPDVEVEGLHLRFTRTVQADPPPACPN